jgi:diguanylate cyclase (GGDEF)-like protein
VGELVEMFLRELHTQVDFDGVQFVNKEQGIELARGNLMGNNLSYSLSVKGERLGEIAFFRSYEFARQEVRSLEDMLAALLYPLRNTLQYRSALMSSLIDPLTRINNRAAMDVVLPREVELSHRQATPMAVILLDIDHFKQINDTYGHSAGDVCLQSVAHCVADSIRGSDLLFRCGGEEFLVLLSQTLMSGALLLAERIRRHVEDLALPADAQRHISVSLGVAELKAGDNVRSLYERADRALYRAKNQGRNRVEAL